MGNEQCKRKEDRKRLILVNKSKLFSDKLNNKENSNVFIEQQNVVNSHFQHQFREQFAREARPICMLVTLRDFEERILPNRKDIKYESICPWLEADTCLVFYSDDNRSRKTVLSASKQREEQEENIIKVELNFNDPEFVARLERIAEGTREQMFIGHTVASNKRGKVTLYSKQNSDILGYRSNDGVQVEEVGSLDQNVLQELIHQRKESDNMFLKTIIEDPASGSRWAIFEKRNVMSLIKFFTVHEYKAPIGNPTLELVERELNKQLVTWDMDCGLYRVVVCPYSKRCFFIFNKMNLDLGDGINN